MGDKENRTFLSEGILGGSQIAKIFCQFIGIKWHFIRIICQIILIKRHFFETLSINELQRRKMGI